MVNESWYKHGLVIMVQLLGCDMTMVVNSYYTHTVVFSATYVYIWNYVWKSQFNLEDKIEHRSICMEYTALWLWNMNIE